MKKKPIIRGRSRSGSKKLLTIMKLTTLFLFVSAMAMAAGSYSQNVRFSLKLRNASIIQVLEEIEKQTEFGFMFKSDELNLDERFTLNLTNAKIGTVMDQVLDGDAYNYQVMDRIIVISKNELDKAVTSVQQQSGLTGKVTDSAGLPLPGVAVLVKGTSNGSVTNMDGKYTITKVPEDAVLVFSFVGMKAQEISVGGRLVIDVTMEEETIGLEEVVAIGYGTLEKKQVTNAVTSLGSEDLMVGVGGADISSALQGKIGGLVMYNVGSPNASTTFQLRGMSSLNAGNNPLVVIDGFPGGDIRSLTQDDIKSIDILKDASAAAIYGTRAAAGVIIVTTKSGSNTNGKVNLSYNTEFSHKQNYNAPDMLSASEYVGHGIGTDYGSDVNWWDELINTSNLSQKHHVTMDVGTEKAQMYTSFFYEDNEGISFQDSRKDYGGRLNANFNFFDGWLQIRPNVSYRQASRNNRYPNYQQALRNNPTRSPFDENSQTGYNVWTNESLDYNVLADAFLGDYEGIDKWFKPEVTLKLNIKAVPGLSYEQVIGYENRQWENHSYTSKYHRSEIENGRNGSAYLGFSKTENKISQGYVSYIKEVDNKHTFNLVGGYDYFERNGESFSMNNYDFSVDDVKFWNIGEGSFLSDGKASMSSSKNVTERLFALFARANYSFLDKYVVQASIRHEGSSKFAEDNRWANFWSASAGWRISKEEFMSDLTWVDDLKLRFAYGVTGNNDFSSTYMANLLGSDTYWMLPDGTWAYSYGKTQNVNPNLGWEETREWDLGLDYTLFDGRLYGKFDYYNKTTEDMLYSVKVPQPPYTQGSQIQNIGSMEAKGWEFEVGGEVINANDFRWTSNMNLSHQTSKIKTLYGDNTYINGNGFVAPGSPGDAARIEEGTKIGSFYMWKFAGFDEDGAFLLYNKDGEVIPAVDKTENDKQYIGNYYPAIIAGWNNTFTYKNWDLGVNLRSWINFDVYNTINMYYGIQDQGNTNVLKDTYGKFDHIKGEKQICDYYLEDGTFLKIDAITLGYTFPVQNYTKYISNARLFCTVGNVATFTSYSGMNPEVNVTGWNNGTEKFWSDFYPVVRTYTIGLKLNF